MTRRIALIADIHANLYALEAVLLRCTALNVDEIWNAGDFIGYGPHPDEVVQRVKHEPILSILGNYDRKVLKINQKSAEWKQKKDPLKYYAFRWAFEQLSSDSISFLENLPEIRRMEVERRSIMLVHGSPESRQEHLGPLTPDERLGYLAARAKTDILICGHSHQAFSRQVENTWFVNPGSVGRPDDGDARSSFALLELDASTLTIQFFRQEYDLERTTTEMRKKGLPEEFVQMLKQGRSLDAIQT